MMTFPQTMLKYIASGDHGLMRRLNRWPAPRWFRWWMISATRGGDGWLWSGLGLLLIFLGGPDRFWAVGEAAAASALGVLAFRYIKTWTGRRRPCAVEPHCWSTLLPPDQFSFPSGHTITAFAVTTPLAAYYPEAAPVLYFAAISIAVSRVVLGMHFLSDVLAGAAIGIGLGHLVHWAARLLG